MPQKQQIAYGCSSTCGPERSGMKKLQVFCITALFFQLFVKSFRACHIFSSANKLDALLDICEVARWRLQPLPVLRRAWIASSIGLRFCLLLSRRDVQHLPGDCYPQHPLKPIRPCSWRCHRCRLASQGSEIVEQSVCGPWRCRIRCKPVLNDVYIFTAVMEPLAIVFVGGLRSAASRSHSPPHTARVVCGRMQYAPSISMNHMNHCLHGKWPMARPVTGLGPGRGRQAVVRASTGCRRSGLDIGVGTVHIVASPPYRRPSVSRRPDGAHPPTASVHRH